MRQKVAPAAGMGVTSLGKLVAGDPGRAGRKLAQILAKRHSSISAMQWYKTIGPGVLSPDPFLKLFRRAR